MTKGGGGGVGGRKGDTNTAKPHRIPCTDRIE